MATAIRRLAPNDSAHALAQGLGWFSIALGAAELLAPHALARWLGAGDRAALIRAYGAREVANGIGIVARDDRLAPWLWGRVAGDALDLATLAAALHVANPRRANVGLALAAVAGVTALDVVCAVQLSRRA